MVAIMALAAVMVVPNVRSLDSRSFATQVREAHTLLNYARRIAVVTGQPASIAFVTDPEQDSPPSLARDNVGIWQSAEMALEFLDSKDLQSAVDDVLEVSFYPEGGSSGGTLTFAQGQQQASIFIDPFTGRVELLDPDDGAGS